MVDPCIIYGCLSDLELGAVMLDSTWVYLLEYGVPCQKKRNLGFTSCFDLYMDIVQKQMYGSGCQYMYFLGRNVKSLCTYSFHVCHSVASNSGEGTMYFFYFFLFLIVVMYILF